MDGRPNGSDFGRLEIPGAPQIFDPDAAELWDVLRINASRANGVLFKEWDADLEGRISKVEFRRALAKLGLQSDRRAADALFLLLDDSHHGAVPFGQLNDALRTGSLHGGSGDDSFGCPAFDSAPDVAKAAPRQVLRSQKSMSSHPLMHAEESQALARKSERNLGSSSPDASRSGEGPADTAAVVAQLREALSANATRVIDLFSEWDDNGDGRVSKVEFRRALPMIGLSPSKRDADRLFDCFDPDLSGHIEYREINKLLRPGADVTLKKGMQPGGAGEVATSSRNVHQLRRRKSNQSGMLRGIDLDEDGDKPVADQLRETLCKHAVRVIDLFREWDEDSNGVVDRGEFRKAMPMLGLEVPREVINKLFDSWDPDGSGAITISELTRQLRHTPDVEIDAALRIGAKTNVFFRSKNRVQLRKLKGVAGSSYATLCMHTTDGAELQRTLRDALQANHWRMVELFKAWGKEEDTLVSREEFASALPLVGMRQLDKKVVASLFLSYCHDSSGAVVLRDLQRQLRRGNQVALKKDPAAAAASNAILMKRAFGKSPARKHDLRKQDSMSTYLTKLQPSPLPVRRNPQHPAQAASTLVSTLVAPDKTRASLSLYKGPLVDVAPGGQTAASLGGLTTGRLSITIAPRVHRMTVQTVVNVPAPAKPTLDPTVQGRNWVWLHLWRPGGEPAQLLVADTIIVERGQLHAWLFTAKDGGVRRKCSDKLSTATIKEAFEQGSIGSGRGGFSSVVRRRESSTQITDDAQLRDVLREPQALGAIENIQRFVASVGHNGTRYRCEMISDRHGGGVSQRMFFSKLVYLGADGLTEFRNGCREKTPDVHSLVSNCKELNARLASATRHLTLKCELSAKLMVLHVSADFILDQSDRLWFIGASDVVTQFSPAIAAPPRQPSTTVQLPGGRCVGDHCGTPKTAKKCVAPSVDGPLSEEEKRRETIIALAGGLPKPKVEVALAGPRGEPTHTIQFKAILLDRHLTANGVCAGAPAPEGLLLAFEQKTRFAPSHHYNCVGVCENCFFKYTLRTAARAAELLTLKHAPSLPNINQKSAAPVRKLTGSQSASMMRVSRSLPELVLQTLRSVPRVSASSVARLEGKLPRLGAPGSFGSGGEVLRTALQARVGYGETLSDEEMRAYKRLTLASMRARLQDGQIMSIDELTVFKDLSREESMGHMNQAGGGAGSDVAAGGDVAATSAVDRTGAAGQTDSEAGVAGGGGAVSAE